MKSKTKKQEIEPLGKATKIRIILDLDADAADRVDQLAKSLRLKRRTDVIRYALGLLGLFQDNREQGYELLLRKGQETIRVVVPTLQ
ncbi:MAG: hypothetical protein LZF60_340169 [Nitrospira sp.]|nr:MAG: hypothetical protein LZF60_340169 [Nitrospira sp.]